MDHPHGTRVLQVLPDTDDSPQNRSALALHGALAAAGLQPRTLALAPGRTGGLAATVPVMAPARRSLAAFTQLRAESRWADVVIFRGVRSLPPGAPRCTGLPFVLLSDGAPIPDVVVERLARGRRLGLLVDDASAAVSARDGVAVRVVPAAATEDERADLLASVIGQVTSGPSR